MNFVTERNSLFLFFKRQSRSLHRAIFTNLCMLAFIANSPSLATGVSQLKNKKAPSDKALSVVEAVEMVRPSIVQIKVTVKNQNLNPMRYDQVLGTGFIVSKEGYVITANHVVSVSSIQVASRNSDGSQAIVQTPIDPTMMRIAVAMPEINTSQVKMQNSFNIFEFDVIEQDARHDIALLKFKNNPFEMNFRPAIKTGEIVVDTSSKVVSAKLNKLKPKDGEQVIISGYPSVATTLVTTVGHIASTGEINHAQILVPSPFPNIPGPIRQVDFMDLYLVDITANPGNSGGPVYSSKTGEIIGICQGGKITNSYYAGLAVIVPIRYAVELLLKHKVAM